MANIIDSLVDVLGPDSRVDQARRQAVDASLTTLLGDLRAVATEMEFHGEQAVNLVRLFTQELTGLLPVLSNDSGLAAVLSKLAVAKATPADDKAAAPRELWQTRAGNSAEEVVPATGLGQSVDAAVSPLINLVLKDLQQLSAWAPAYHEELEVLHNGLAAAMDYSVAQLDQLDAASGGGISSVVSTVQAYQELRESVTELKKRVSALMSSDSKSDKLVAAGAAGWAVGTYINDNYVTPNEELSDKIGGTLMTIAASLGSTEAQLALDRHFAALESTENVAPTFTGEGHSLATNSVGQPSGLAYAGAAKAPAAKRLEAGQGAAALLQQLGLSASGRSTSTGEWGNAYVRSDGALSGEQMRAGVQLGAAVRASAAPSGGVTSSETTIQKIEIHTQATNASGIAREIGPALGKASLVYQASTGDS